MLSPQQPHGPTCDEHAAEKHDETIKAIADHLARRVTVRDAEDDGREQGKDRRRTEMI